MIKLSIIPKELLLSIESLPKDEQKRLAKFIIQQPIHSSIGMWIEGEFDKSTSMLCPIFSFLC